MDTKSKNTKRYPLIVKALCLVLCVLCFLGTGVSAAYGMLAASFLPRSGDVTPVSFYSSDLFLDMVTSDLGSLSSVLYEPQRQKDLAAYRAQRDETIEAQVQRFLTEKAAIIRAEIYFVATHYEEIEEGDYYYNAYMRDFSTTTTTAAQAAETPTVPHTENAEDESTTATTAPPETTTVPNGADLSALPKLTVDERAPYNVRYCQSLCNTVTGLDWLKYASLVRDSAFSEQAFCPSFGDLGSRGTYAFTCTEQQIRAELSQEYDELLQDMETSDTSYERSRLEGLCNLKYLAVASDGTVTTNMQPSERNGRNILSHGRYILCKDGKIAAQMQDAALEASVKSIVADQIEPTGGTLFVYFEEPFAPGDRYASAKALFDNLFVENSPKNVLIAGVACAFGTLFFFVTLLCLCGHKRGFDGITPAFIDRVPTDVHLLLSGACIAACVIPAFIILYDLPSYAYDIRGAAFTLSSLIPRVAAAVCLITLGFLCGLEWLTSTVRIKKAGESYFRKFVLWKVFLFAFRCVRFCVRKVVGVFRFLFDKPKKLRYLPFVLLAIFIGGTLLVLMISVAADSAAPVAVFVPLLTVLLLVSAVWFLRKLDRIADCAETRTDLPESELRRMPRALRALAESQSVTNRELDKAVADAVRNERTKAELITNVSHDLKTPLTSVITYVDLLKKCDVTDEKALEYIDILDEKSAKLKRLVEDLIEASKVNTGNVTLQCVPLNLAELSMQAVTEAAPDFEKNGLELRFNPSDAAPIVFADGSKTYRVLDNLLSNAKKYSAPGSRVYAKVDENDAYGIFEIKNISREPLDVEPQELMERFVRGDRSRTQDGNGLGLSIAQQLCLLQGGRLEIGIDGDLFKAVVFLPKRKAADGNAPQG